MLIWQNFPQFSSVEYSGRNILNFLWSVHFCQGDPNSITAFWNRFRMIVLHFLSQLLHVCLLCALSASPSVSSWLCRRKWLCRFHLMFISIVKEKMRFWGFWNILLTKNQNAANLFWKPGNENQFFQQRLSGLLSISLLLPLTHHLIRLCIWSFGCFPLEEGRSGYPTKAVFSHA